MEISVDAIVLKKLDFDAGSKQTEKSRLLSVDFEQFYQSSSRISNTVSSKV